LTIRQDVGALWDNYIISGRRKVNFNERLHKEFYFCRTYDRQEIDLIEESSESLTALEFKWRGQEAGSAARLPGGLSASRIPRGEP